MGLNTYLSSPSYSLPCCKREILSIQLCFWMFVHLHFFFYKKNRFAFYAYSFFFQEEFRWRLTCIDLLFDSLMLSLPFPLCVNKVSWSGENFVLREGGVESLPWWRSIRKTWQSCSRLWKRWWQLWASCSSSETWAGFFKDARLWPYCLQNLQHSLTTTSL